MSKRISKSGSNQEGGASRKQMAEDGLTVVNGSKRERWSARTKLKASTSIMKDDDDDDV
jgi:hypothetical protein